MLRRGFVILVCGRFDARKDGIVFLFITFHNHYEQVGSFVAENAF